MLGKYQVSDPQNHGSYPIFLSIGSYNCIPANPLNNKSPTKRSKKSHPEKKHIFARRFQRVVGISDHFSTIFPGNHPEITIFRPTFSKRSTRAESPPQQGSPQVTTPPNAQGMERWLSYLFTIIPYGYIIRLYIITYIYIYIYGLFIYIPSGYLT